MTFQLIFSKDNLIIESSEYMLRALGLYSPNTHGSIIAHDYYYSTLKNSIYSECSENIVQIVGVYSPNLN